MSYEQPTEGYDVYLVSFITSEGGDSCFIEVNKNCESVAYEIYRYLRTEDRNVAIINFWKI